MTKYGRRIVTMTVLSGFVVGELCSSIGVTILNYYLLLFGQIVIGCSLNCWLAVSSTYLSIWFKNRETAFAISLDTCCCYLAVSITNFAHPRIYNKFKSLKGNYWMLFIITLFSFTCGLILCYLDTHAPKQEEEKPKEGEEAFSLKAIKKLPITIWLLCGSQLTVLQCFQLQDIIASKMFQDLFGLDNEAAGIVIASPALLLGVLSFFSGIIVYRIGRKPLLCNKTFLYSGWKVSNLKNHSVASIDFGAAFNIYAKCVADVRSLVCRSSALFIHSSCTCILLSSFLVCHPVRFCDWLVFV